MNQLKHNPPPSDQQDREAIMFTARRARLGIQTHPLAFFGITVATPFGTTHQPFCIAVLLIVALMSFWRWTGSNKILRERCSDTGSVFLWLVLPAVLVNGVWSAATATIILTEGISTTSLIMLLGSVALTFGCILNFGLLRKLGLTLTAIHLFPPFIASLTQSGSQAMLLAILFVAFFFYILRVSTMVYEDYWKAATTRQHLAEAHAGAERANRVKDQFLANMGHEIRTPLNGIVGPVELLLQESLSDEQKKYAELISSSANTLAQLIDDLLDFSKIEAEKLSLKNQPFYPEQLLSEVIARHEVSASRKSLEIRPQFDSLKDIQLLGDRLRLGQVVENLLTNAIKFTDHGNVTIDASYNTGGKTAHHLFIAVSDSGCGIPDELKPRIFQPFVQADTSFSRTHQGTGLGLSICKRLVELMRGTIEFTSTDQGTRFDIRIPLTIATADTLSSDAEISCPLFTGLTVLVAEDNPINQSVIRSQLERLKIDADIVSNGAEAVNAVAERTYDLIILDCQMPVVDGYEAARRIRALGGRYRSIPIVALSAHALNSDVQAALAAGMNSYLNKPASIQSLSDTIAQWT